MHFRTVATSRTPSLKGYLKPLLDVFFLSKKQQHPIAEILCQIDNTSSKPLKTFLENQKSRL